MYIAAGVLSLSFVRIEGGRKKSSIWNTMLSGNILCRWEASVVFPLAHLPSIATSKGVFRPLSFSFIYERRLNVLPFFTEIIHPTGGRLLVLPLHAYAGYYKHKAGNGKRQHVEY